MLAVNARLPDDVLVRSIEVVPDEFNPIMGAVSKGYTYTLWCSDHRPLWPRRTAMHFWQRMDVEAMRAAAAEIVGTHDFKAFAAAGHGRLTTVRTVFGCEVLEEGIEGSGDQGIGTEDPNAPVVWPRQGGLTGEADGPVQKLVIRVWGNGFLWNMVRIIAGTLIEAGKGRCSPERVREALRTGNRRLAGSTLPAHGLCLEWIRYGEVGASIVVNEE
jgi:tRNA pseudouridine38-40 synthase